MVTCGVDEAGRGPLAGPVYAAAVILSLEKPISGLKDSKILSAKKREFLYDEIVNKALCYNIASCNVEEIDRLNILNASLLAMKKAVDGLTLTPDLVLVDGNKAPDIMITVKTIIKGDSLINEISAASILAKVTRDRFMVELAKKFPFYGFEKHKGYGTNEHLNAIKKYGVIDEHRRSYAPIKLYS